ncbi:MAG: isopentenyl phosphate kinase [Candidatus Aenigmatarchaeota archaeon]
MAERIVMKIGGSIISEKDPSKLAGFPLTADGIRARGQDYMRLEEIARVAREIKEAMDESGSQLILVNGAGPFGHLLVKSVRPDEDVRASVRFQNERLVSELRAAGIDAVPVPPSESCAFDGSEFDIEYLWEIAAMLLEEGKTPSTYGDVLADGKIISGDDLVVLLAKAWKADRIIAATDVDGVYTKDPKTNADAEFIAQLRTGDIGTKPEYALNSIDVTGGMQSKIEKLKEAAAAGMKCRIINGLTPGNVKAALLGDEGFGTSIVA